jgi:hypothetical protein
MVRKVVSVSLASADRPSMRRGSSCRPGRGVASSASSHSFHSALSGAGGAPPLVAR